MHEDHYCEATEWYKNLKNIMDLPFKWHDLQDTAEWKSGILTFYDLCGDLAFMTDINILPPVLTDDL